jgi:hypothetical protein
MSKHVADEQGDVSSVKLPVSLKREISDLRLAERL